MLNKISIVIPCYNEEKVLPYFYEQVQEVAEKMSYIDFELLFIDDGSKDKTLEIIKSFKSADSRINYISFSRNFGKEAGIYAGLQYAMGDFVALMDADLQDPPMLLEEMYHAIISEGYDCVATRRRDRHGEPPIHSLFARRFYWLINKISKTEIVEGARDFRLMTRQMVEAILSVSEYNRFSKGIFGWVGYKTKWLEYENVGRVAGESKWSFGKLLLYSFEGIIAFSTAPLAIASFTGIMFCLLSIVMIGVIMFKTFIWGDPVPGWPSLACIVLLVGGIQLFCIGILGEYLSKTYMETKRRPIFIIRESGLNKGG